MESSTVYVGRVPYIDLSRISEIVGLLNLSFGTAGLLLALGLDAWRSKSKKSHWIPGDSIVLGALSLQLLGLFYRPIIKYSDLDCGNVIDHNSELLNIGGRVVWCVFFGILLPDVARSRDRNVWSDMLALSIGATGVLVYLFSDIYVRLERSDGFILGDSIFVSSIIIFASIVLVVLLLGCAALASKSIQEFVAHRVRVLLSRTEYLLKQRLTCNVMFISGRRKTSRSREFIVVVGKDGGLQKNINIILEIAGSSGGFETIPQLVIFL